MTNSKINFTNCIDLYINIGRLLELNGHYFSWFKLLYKQNAIQCSQIHLNNDQRH